MRKNILHLSSMRLLGFGVGLLMAATILTGSIRSAHAGTACGDRETIVERLTTLYNEYRASMMVDAAGNLVEIYSNLDTGTWTLLITRPQGATCVVSSGGNFIDTANDRVVGEPA